MDLRDLLIRTGWTAVAAALAFLVEALDGSPTWWAPLAVTGFTAALVYVRQRAAVKLAEVKAAPTEDWSG